MAVAALALFVLNVLQFNSVVDDAYISFRYLDNWLAGEGLVYNPGERVEGYTNLLWIVLLSPFRLAGLKPEGAAQLLSLVAVALALWAIFRGAKALAGAQAAGWAALVLAAGSVPLARWAMSGMETACVAALLALANERLCTCGRLTGGAAFFWGLALLARPDAALLAACAFAVAALRQGSGRKEAWRRLAGPALLLAAMAAGHVAFRLLYYGSPLPNTYYAKLTGELPGLLLTGLVYLWRFFINGGYVLVAGLLVAWRTGLFRHWIPMALATQIGAHLLYVAWIGGDHFAFHRFIVPVIPLLSILAGAGLYGAVRSLAPGNRWALPAAALLLTLVQSAQAYASQDARLFRLLLTARQDREMVATWLLSRLPADTLLAINVAGVIPYRTGMPTLDMLGLNDRHIAAVKAGSGVDGYVTVGHFKHDGAYVCERQPGAVVTSDGELHTGRSAQEAIMQTALNTFPGDREFLRAPDCAGWYRAEAEELQPGRFAVVYVRTAEPARDPSAPALTAKDWFHRGVELMGQAQLQTAVRAFQTSLQLEPGHPEVMANLGFCFFDLQDYAAAIKVFEDVLRLNERRFEALFGLAQSHEKLGDREQAAALWRRYIAQAPESPWKERARAHLYALTGARE